MAANRVALYASVGPELTHYDVDVEARDADPARHRHVAGQYALLLAARLAAASSMSRRATAPPGSAGLPAPSTMSRRWRSIRHRARCRRIGEPIALPTRPIHMTTDIPSAHILVAFSNPSGLRVYRVNPDGTPGAEVTQPEPIDPGIYGHQVRVSLDNRKVILVTRGHDAAGGKPEEPGALKVFDYRDGQLTNEVSVAPNGGYGFGPRHLDFHPTKPWVYVVARAAEPARHVPFDESGSAVGRGRCSSKDTLAEPGNIRGRQVVGTVHVHPSGRFVYVANRASSTVEANGTRVFAGGENTLAVFAIDPATGEPNADPARRYARHPLPHVSYRPERASAGRRAHHGAAGAATAAARASCRPACRCSASAATAGSNSSANTMSMSATGRCSGWAWWRCKRLGRQEAWMDASGPSITAIANSSQPNRSACEPSLTRRSTSGTGLA